ncbi:MAG TPA: serine hydrolase [Candidatus Angelobacter sp.]|nr:serine hydrolase [Candidatus Angelobacter sp.]
MIWRRICTQAVVLVLFGLFAVAQAPTPQSALERLFHAPVQESWFDQQFLAQVPATRVQQLIQEMTASSGPLQRIETSGEGYSVVLEKATVPARIALNPEGRIIALLFGPPQPLHTQSIQDAVKEFEKLSGKVNVAVTENGKFSAGLHADDPLAVASAFKMAVLATLRTQVAAGTHHWDEVVTLLPKWKSLPSGVLQTWPDNTQLTLATLANEMISISDNTAADALLDITGRQNVETLTSRNRPLLSTREMFVLKAPVYSSFLVRFRAANEQGKRAVLTEVAQQPLPAASIFAGDPLALDVEWFFTANELCGLMAKVEDLPAMRINSGLARPADWKQVAFKGGAESGVLTLTHGLVGKNGRHYCVSATWNDTKRLDGSKFYAAYTDLLAALVKESAGE